MSRYNRLVVRRILPLVLAATALSGCAVLPPVLSGVSSAITIGEWLRARARAGLPPQENPVGNPSAGADDPAANSSSVKDPYQAALENAYREMWDRWVRDEEAAEPLQAVDALESPAQ